MVIRQGDVFWVDVGPPRRSGPGYRYPYVVIQNNVFNQSRINSVVVCALTSKMSRAALPGNVALRKGEAKLPKASVVNVTQLFTVDRSDLREKVGTLSPGRVDEILAGVRLVLDPRDAD